MSKLGALKIVLISHGILSFVAGLPMFIFPKMWSLILEWQPLNEPMVMTLGAVAVAVGISSFIAQMDPRTHVGICEMEIALNTFLAMSFLYNLLHGLMPPISWLFFATFALFGLVFILLYPGK